MKETILLFSLILSATGCQTTAPSKTQNLECYVRFLQTEQTWRAEASVRESIGGQTSVATQLPAGVKFEEKEMRWLEQGQRYQTEFSSSGKPEFTFTWAAAEKQPRQFKMAMPAAEDFNFSEAKLSRKKVATLTWQGLPMGDNEQLLLFWENPQHGVVQMPIISAAARPMIEIPATKIAELKTGAWQLYLVRKKAFKTSENGMDAQGLAEFYSKTKTFEVVD